MTNARLCEIYNEIIITNKMLSLYKQIKIANLNNDFSEAKRLYKLLEAEKQTYYQYQFIVRKLSERISNLEYNLTTEFKGRREYL